MRLVLDASVTVKWFVRDTGAESDLDKAAFLLRSLERRNHIAVQPPHWIAEVLAVVVRLRPRRTDAVISLLPLVGGIIVPQVRVYQTAAALAKSTGTHVFDTLYHAVALECDATLVTADRRYLDKAAALGNIVGLADFKA